MNPYLTWGEAVFTAEDTKLHRRDLKPDNIMVDDEGRLRVLDFGLANRKPADSD